MMWESVIRFHLEVFKQLFCMQIWETRSKEIFSSGANRKKGNSWSWNILRRRLSCQAKLLGGLCLENKCFRVLFGEILLSFENLNGTRKVEWFSRRIMAEGYKLTATGSKSDGNNGRFTEPRKWKWLELETLLSNLF